MPAFQRVHGIFQSHLPQSSSRCSGQVTASYAPLPQVSHSRLVELHFDAFAHIGRVQGRSNMFANVLDGSRQRRAAAVPTLWMS